MTLNHQIYFRFVHQRTFVYEIHILNHIAHHSSENPRSYLPLFPARHMRHLSDKKASIILKTIPTKIYFRIKCSKDACDTKNSWQTRTHEKQGHQSDKGTPEVAELNHEQTIVSDKRTPVEAGPTMQMLCNHSPSNNWCHNK